MKLPWKEGMKEQLLNNKPTDQVRRNGQKRRLSKDEKLRKCHDAALSEMKKLGIIAVVPFEETTCNEIVHYLSHHPVVKESILKTETRPVWSMDCCLMILYTLGPLLTLDLWISCYDLGDGE